MWQRQIFFVGHEFCVAERFSVGQYILVNKVRPGASFLGRTTRHRPNIGVPMLPIALGVSNAPPRPQLIVNHYGIFVKIGGHTRKIEAEEVVSRYGAAVASAMIRMPNTWIEIDNDPRAEAA